MYSMDISSLISRGMNGKKRNHYVRIAIEACYIEATGQCLVYRDGAACSMQ